MGIKLEHRNPNSVGKPTESLPATTSSNTTSAAATFTVKIIKFNSDWLLLYFVSKESLYAKFSFEPNSETLVKGKIKNG